MPSVPEFSRLTPSECSGLLARNHIGRLAFRTDKGVDVEPLGYAAGGSWLYMRSAQGAKLEAIAHNPYVAFEVDEVDGPYDWRSVVAHGTIYIFDEKGSPDEQRHFHTAVDALRTAIPNTLGATDSVPERRTVYGLHIDNIEGRKAESRLRGSRARTANGARKPMSNRGSGHER